MKYFLDTEFIEGFHKPLFGKRRHFIDLISIGIVCEDGRSLYLISNEYSYKDADDWVKENVIIPLYRQTVHGDMRNNISAENFQNFFGWNNTIIANKVLSFVGGNTVDMTCDTSPEFYAYYADYDWIVFCSLFGRMIDLPHGFPMYCNDLKQSLDERASKINQIDLTTHLFAPQEKDGWQIVPNAQISRDIIDINDYSLSMKLEILKGQEAYPKQENEHSALDDAKWNFELFKYINPKYKPLTP